jgi:signal peptidase
MVTMTAETPTTTEEVVPTHLSPWRRMRSIVSTGLIALLMVVASIAVVLSVATHFSPKGQYDAFGHPVMSVLSGSMSPLIHTGDLIIDDPVTPTQAARLHVGQVISVRDTPGSPLIVTHRIVAIVHSGATVAYITKGDANNAPDSSPRPVADVVGVFSTSVPVGGYVLNALHRPLVPLLLFASISLGLLAGPLFRWARRMDQSGTDSDDESEAS